MKNYYRIMLGRQSVHADEAHKGSYIGAGWLSGTDLTGQLLEDWREFNRKFIPVYLESNPGKGKIAAGLACGMLWTVARGIQIGDIVLCPNGQGSYLVGEVSGDYQYRPGTNLPHQRPVRWFPRMIAREELSESLRHSTGSIGTVSNVSRHSAEIESLLAGNHPPAIIATDETVEDPSTFALEEHLEDFLVENWRSTELGKNYDIYEEDGEMVGQQYPSDTGPIDILAISKDKKELLVLELKRGRASDVVVGQIQRYMGYVKDELAEADQVVRGIIIALDNDTRIKRALSVAQGIELYTYKVHFHLQKQVQ